MKSSWQQTKINCQSQSESSSMLRLDLFDMETSNLWQRMAEFMALRRNTSLLLVALVLAGTGEKLWLGFAPKYLQTLGASILVIGLFDALQTLLGALYAYPGGWLTDAWGQRRSLMLFSAISLGGYAIVLAWHHWLALLLGAFLFLAWSALSLPTTFAVVATSLQADRHTMGIGIQSMVRRVPMMVGPLAGGWLISHYGWQEGIQKALIICIVLTLVTMVFQWLMIERSDSSTPTKGPGHKQPPLPGPLLQGRRGNPRSGRETKLFRDDQAAPASSVSPVNFSAVVRSFTPALRELLVSDILIRFCERIPYAFVVLWAMNHARLDAQQFGYLVSFEMIAAMVCYIPVAHLADKYGRRPFVLATFGFFTLFPITLIWANSFGWLGLAFVVRGLKEFGEPARKALIIGEAVPELRARTYGAYYLIRDCVVTTGSFLGAWLWSLGPRVNFAGAAICGGLGTIWFWWFIYRKRRGD